MNASLIIISAIIVVVSIVLTVIVLNRDDNDAKEVKELPLNKNEVKKL